MAKNDGKFKLIKKTKFSDIKEGFELPESDLCFQNEDIIAQFEYVKDEDEEEDQYEIKPGTYTLVDTLVGVRPKKTSFKKQELLETIDNTKAIVNEAKTFFSRLHVYEQLGRPKKRGVLLYSSPGMGKCLGENTPILMYDGSVKMVQDVIVGDALMGPDSTPRNVLSTVSGKEQLYQIIPNKGEPYIVNESHILSLRMSDSDELYNISVKDYLELPAHKKERLKGWRVGVEFEDFKDELIIDPYFLGLWLGDGTSSKSEICSADEEILNYAENYFSSLALKTYKTKEANNLMIYRAASGISHGPRNRNILLNMLRNYSLINNKHIPLIYKTASRKNRLKLLAGIVDADGSVYNGIVDFCLKSKQLTEDTAFLARSLGFAAYIEATQKTCTNSKNKTTRDYFRLQISGDTDQIPTKLLRKQASKQKQIKNHLRTDISIRRLEVGEYFGFDIDSDKLFMLGDFTVTHNTSAIAKFSNDFIKEDSGTVVFNWPTSDIEADDVAKFLNISSAYTEQCTRLILVIEDIGGGERENGGHANQVDSGLLNLLDGVDINFKLPTFIVATTNYPENLLGALADRPGRFDLMLQLGAPSKEEKIKLAEFIAKRKLNDEERVAFDNPKMKDFSIAHLEEIIVRSLLHDKTIPQVIEELIQHKERFHRAFEKDKGIGIGFRE